MIIVISGEAREGWHEYSVTLSGVHLVMWVHSVCVCVCACVCVCRDGLVAVYSVCTKPASRPTFES